MDKGRWCLSWREKISLVQYHYYFVFVQIEVISLQKTPHRTTAHHPFIFVKCIVSDFANLVGLMIIFHRQLQGLGPVSCSVPTVIFFL